MIIAAPKYSRNQKVYLYIGRSCIMVRILSSYMNKNDEWLYETDCSNYSKDLVLINVPERCLGKTVNMKKGAESFTIEYFDNIFN